VNDRDVTGAASTDRIELRGLRLRGHHGVFDHERADGQDFVVDLVLGLDTSAAARSDALADTVDYGALALSVAAVVGGEPVNLLETLADRIARACLRDDRVFRAEVTVHKPQAPIPASFTDVMVTVVRRRDEVNG
jgi:7,8-dihydroneopterin aldolase/epimerase/oxygenase